MDSLFFSFMKGNTMTFKIPIWTLIPALAIVTVFYYGLGVMGHWTYTKDDVIYGNLFVVGLVIICYVVEWIYIKFKKSN